MSSEPGAESTAKTRPLPPAHPGGRAHLWAAAILILAAAAAGGHALRLRQRKESLRLTLRVDSRPAPAEVRLDGRFVGLTPLELPRVAAGQHQVLVLLDGYEVYSVRRQMFSPEERLSAELVRQPTGALIVRSTPEGAEVILDGQSRGNTPLDLENLAPGSYRLVLRKAGHEFWQREVSVRVGERAEIGAELENSVLKFLRDAVAANPEALHYWTELGHYLGSHDMDEESVAAFIKGMELCAKEGVSGEEVTRHFQMLGRQMNWPGKNRAEFRRKIGEAFARLVRENSVNPKVALRFGTVLEQAHRYNEALELYVNGFRNARGADSALLVRAFSLAARLRKLKEAEEVLQLVRTALPREITLRLKLAGICLQSSGRYPRAQKGSILEIGERLYGEAAELTSDAKTRASAYYGVARARNLAGRTAEAAESYGRAAEAILDGGKGDRRKWAEWQFEKGSLLVKLGRKDDAKAVFSKIVADAAGTPAASRAKRELESLESE
jgi:tetratricopeptide (TPR) repeat protein